MTIDKIDTALRAAAGNDAMSPAATVDRWRARYGHLLEGDRAVAAGVRVESFEMLQAVFTVARDMACSVWCFADRAGFGAVAGPSTQNVICIDLSGMNRILEIDPVSACVLVEPGVTYRQLDAELKARHPGFWLDCGRDGDRSVAAGIVGRGFGYTPYGDRTLMQCGMELMLGDGTLVRTGMGALPTSNMWQLFKYGFGPYTDGSFQQSDLGIVTKVGSWIMPAPPAYKPFMLKLADERALTEAVEVLRPLKITPVIPNTVAIGHAQFETAKLGASDVANHGGIEPGLGQWNVFAALYGAAEDIDITWRFISGALGAVRGAELVDDIDSVDNPLLRRRAALMRGALADDAAASIVLSAAAPIEGEAAVAMYRHVSRVLDEHDFPHLCEFLLSWRTLMLRVELRLDEDDPDSILRARRCGLRLVDSLTEAGYGVVNASPELLVHAKRHYSGGLGQVRHRLKRALDPSDLIAG